MRVGMGVCAVSGYTCLCSVFNFIPKYVNDNIDKVHIDEKCKQIADTIRQKMQMEMSPFQSQRSHYQSLLDRKVMNCLILKDSRGLMRTTFKINGYET